MPKLTILTPKSKCAKMAELADELGTSLAKLTGAIVAHEIANTKQVVSDLKDCRCQLGSIQTPL